jgi:hypothetical protein
MIRSRRSDHAADDDALPDGIPRGIVLPKAAEDRPVIIVPDQVTLPGNGAAVTPR